MTLDPVPAGRLNAALVIALAAALEVVRDPDTSQTRTAYRRAVKGVRLVLPRLEAATIRTELAATVVLLGAPDSSTALHRSASSLAGRLVMLNARPPTGQDHATNHGGNRQRNPLTGG
jgi:hypothetical protein